MSVLSVTDRISRNIHGGGHPLCVSSWVAVLEEAGRAGQERSAGHLCRAAAGPEVWVSLWGRVL